MLTQTIAMVASGMTIAATRRWSSAELLALLVLLVTAIWSAAGVAVARFSSVTTIS